MIETLQYLNVIRGGLTAMGASLDAMKPQVERYEESLQSIVDQADRSATDCERPPAPMPAMLEHAAYYKAVRTSSEKARCAVVATLADLDALMETIGNTMDRLNTAAEIVAYNAMTTDEGTDDAAV